MLPDRVSNPGPLTYESGALPIALRGPASRFVCENIISNYFFFSCTLRLQPISYPVNTLEKSNLSQND